MERSAVVDIAASAPRHQDAAGVHAGAAAAYPGPPPDYYRGAGAESPPPEYNVAAELPSYEESERTKGELRGHSQVSCSLQEFVMQKSSKNATFMLLSEIPIVEKLPVKVGFAERKNCNRH